MYKTRIFLFLISILFLSGIHTAFTQNTESEQPPDDIISAEIYPGITIPVAGDDEFYENGLLSRFLVDYRFTSFPVFSLLGGFEYDMIPIKALISMSTFTGSGGFGLNFDLTPRLLLKLDSQIGYSYSMINSGVSKGTGAGGFYYSGGGDISYRLTQEWSAGLGASYVNYSSLYQGVRITAKGCYFINLDSTHALTITDNNFIEIFPALINYHNTIPVGNAVILNTERFDVNEIKYELKIKNYMDNVIYSDGPLVMSEKDSNDLKFLPDFNDKLKTASEGKESITTPLEAVIRYKYNNWWYKEKIKKDLVIYNRNSIKWDDPAKTSVFVTPEDPLVQTVVENTTEATENISKIPVPATVLNALALYKTIEKTGITCRPDMNTPYSEQITPPFPVDYIRYPVEVLSEKSGESDELALLYCSMLEAAGIDTAVIIVPEACLAAFALNENESISHSDLMISHEGKIWIPVDLREPGKSFDTAVKNALSLLNRSDLNIYSIKTARNKYLAPAPPEPDLSIKYPEKKDILEIYLEDIKNYAYWEIKPEEEMLKEIQGLDNEYPEITNRLGVLYARFEKYEEAYAEFEKASATGFAPAMVNLANLYFLDDKLEEALPLYEKAYRKNAYNAAMLQNMAVAYYKRLDFGLTRDIYRKLEFIDFELADEVAFMKERSSDMIQASSEGHKNGLNSMNLFTENTMIEKGNQYYLENKLKPALAFYEKAEKMAPDNPEVILSLARINYELDNYYKATEYLNKLKELSPPDADANSYIESQNTGAIMNKALDNLKGEVRWAE